MVYKNLIDPECITFTQENIMYNTRFFLRELVYWTRAYFSSAFSGIGNVQETYERLYNTPLKFAYMLQFILGRPISERYLSLYNQYIIILRELVTAVLNGETEKINESVSRLYQNSEERAEFLSEVFPDLNKDVINDLFNTFIQYEIEELNAYISGDYTRIIEIYDQLALQADKMADYLSAGIVNLITSTPTTPEPGNNSMSLEYNFNNQDLSNCITYQELNTILSIAMFWVELVTWLRAYRISKMTNTGDSEAIYRRLNQVIIDFGTKLKTFLDEETVDRHISLMQEYVRLLDQLLDARLSNNIEVMNQTYQLLLNNINSRTEFFVSVFPSINESEWRNQLYKLNTNLINMATAFLLGDYTKNIEMFDALINQAEELGFYFTQSLFSLMNNNSIPQ